MGLPCAFIPSSSTAPEILIAINATRTNVERHCRMRLGSCASLAASWLNRQNAFHPALPGHQLESPRLTDNNTKPAPFTIIFGCCPSAYGCDGVPCLDTVACLLMFWHNSEICIHRTLCFVAVTRFLHSNKRVSKTAYFLVAFKTFPYCIRKKH